MSEVHVALRGSMATGTSNLLRQAGEMGTNLNRKDLEAVADEHDTDVGSMLEGVDESTVSDVLGSVADDAVECRDAVFESDDEGDEGFFGGDGIDTGDVVEKGKEALDKSAQAVEDCRDTGGSVVWSSIYRRLRALTTVSPRAKQSYTPMALR